MIRTTFFQALFASTDLRERLTGTDEDPEEFRIYQASSLSIVPRRPFMTYRLNNDFPIAKSIGRRAYGQLWANDDPGDYETIDWLLERAREALAAIVPSGTFLEARWIETSPDLRDDVMGTINRYSRFHLTASLRERE